MKEDDKKIRFHKLLSFSDIQIIDSHKKKNYLDDEKIFCNAILFRNHPQVGMALEGKEDEMKQGKKNMKKAS